MILDRNLGAQLSPREVEVHGNELRAISEYASGLHLLNCQITAAENRVLQRSEPGIAHFEMSAQRNLCGEDGHIIGCIFSWYAVTACNLAQTIGWLLRETGHTQLSPKDYRDSVLAGGIVPWRDKVGAHPARACSSRFDSEAERIASVIPRVTWDRDKFRAGALCVAVSSGESASTSEKIGMWALTEVHPLICERFWPFIAVVE